MPVGHGDASGEDIKNNSAYIDSRLVNHRSLGNNRTDSLFGSSIGSAADCLLLPG